MLQQEIARFWTQEKQRRPDTTTSTTFRQPTGPVVSNEAIFTEMSRGGTQEEIAKRLGMSQGNLSVRLQRMKSS